MFKTRLLSGIVLVILLAICLVSGGWILWGILLLTSLAGLRELYQAIGSKNEHLDQKRFDILALFGYFFCIVYYAVLALFDREIGAITVDFRILYLTLLFGLLVFMCIYVFSYPKYEPQDLMSTIFGLFYIPGMLSMIYLIRLMPKGVFLVWMVFVCSWICDTCAYCVGMLFGKHKLAPVLSPKKSVEGAVGGVVGAALVGLIFGLVLTKIRPDEFRLFTALLMMGIGGAGAVFSQIGDLTASAIKRFYGIKDYGALIPGHGGIMDRFDSVFVTAPIIYILVLLFH